MKRSQWQCLWLCLLLVLAVARRSQAGCLFTAGNRPKHVCSDKPLGSGPQPEQLKVTNIVVESGQEYEAEKLSQGDSYYIDRSYVVEHIPAGFEDAIWIKTANDDKQATSKTFLSFEVNKDVDVFIAYDKRATSLPDWMSSFHFDGRSISVSDLYAPSLRLYSRSFSAGTVTLGGNLAPGASGATSNYVVLVTPVGSVPPPGAHSPSIAHTCQPITTHLRSVGRTLWHFGREYISYLAKDTTFALTYGLLMVSLVTILVIQWLKYRNPRD